MKIVLRCALTGALSILLVEACATPVEIEDDVTSVDPNSLGDGGPAVGQGGIGGAGPSPGQGGSAQGGTGFGGNVSVGGRGGAAGTTGGGGAAGSVAGSSGAAGAGGAAGTGGLGGAAGAGGAGGSGAGVFNPPTTCDFEDLTGCGNLACNLTCTNCGGTRCEDLVECVSVTNAGCSTLADPLCGISPDGGGTPDVCTNEYNNAGSGNPNDAAYVAVSNLIECLCTVPRPAP